MCEGSEGVCVGSEDVCGVRVCVGVRMYGGSEGACGCGGGDGGMCDVWMGEEEEGCVTKVLLTHEFGIGNEACGDKFDCAL